MGITIAQYRCTIIGCYNINHVTRAHSAQKLTRYYNKFQLSTFISGSRTEYPTSGIPSGGNAQRLECPTLNFLLGIHDNTPRIPNDAIPNHGIPNDGMSSNYIRYNM